MRSGVLHAPLPAFSGKPSAIAEAGRRSHRTRSATPPLSQPLVVVAGAPRAGKSSLVNALLGAPGCAPVDTAASASAWLVFRSGERPGARAFVPGHREPRPVGEVTGPDGLRVGDTAAAGRGGPSRPPRRIEVAHPAPLLARVTLVDTPGVGDLDAATAEVILDATEQAAGLVFVLDAAVPLRGPQLDLLAQVGPTRRVVFVLTKIDQREDWPAVLEANRTLIADRCPALSSASWLPLALPVEPGPVASIDELLELLEGWAAADEPEPPDATPAGVTSVSVPPDEGGERWQLLLDREIRNRRLAATQQLSIDLATIHVRCVQELGTGQGCPELPYVLDRALHGLSVRVTRQLEADTAAVIERVFTLLLDRPPTAAVLARIKAAARRTVDTLADDEHARDRALLLTTTSAVATLTGPAATDGLSALGRPEPAVRVLPGVGIALNASCYQMWQPRAGVAARGTEKKDCRRWLQQALRAVEVEMARELAGRFEDLRQALAIIAADAVDHGVLLA
jgi:hypothetical protein